MQCFNTTTSCTGPSVTCPSGKQCGVLYTKTTKGGSTDISYIMICISSDQCGQSGSVTTNDIRLKTAASCCSTDNCTPSLPSLPEDSSVYNGVTCPSCLSASSTMCYTSDTIKCTGNENMCLLLQSTQISGSQSLATSNRGCSTKNLCNDVIQSSSANGQSASINFICTSGSTGLRKGFYLPAVICLFFLKLLI
ncbi:phospholipase A2 inhibitor and Ly6/PLAUR domain-containing protein-like isoform X2 [Aquarana catesbeiana]